MKKEDVKIYTSLVKDLSDIMRESKLSKLKFKHKDTNEKDISNKITIEIHDQSHNASHAQPSHIIHQTPPVNHSANSSPAPTPIAENSTEIDYSKQDGVVLSPMVGIIYTSNKPDSPPFVSEGTTVNVGDTLLLIEAMKVFNPIKATVAGTVKKILVKNNTPVEFNEPLVIIE